MQITVLGCGSSYGVPRVACDCDICTSPNPKNKRTRSSIFIEKDGTNLLVDSSVDFRFQALREDIKQIDAVIYTHAHADHVLGLSDFRSLYYLNHKKPIPAYMTEFTYKILRQTHPHVLDPSNPVFEEYIKPILIDPFDKVQIGNIPVQFFEQTHGKIVSLGMRINDFAYSTDFNNLSEKTLGLLNNLDIWILECLRFESNHAHKTYEDALQLISKITPKKAFFTHMCHEIDYDDLERITPDNVSPSYDGLKIITS